jgi:putative tryptophan/tyrosine transport system substrate-binding protein
MNRREFITLLGGTAAWPLAARAQQPAMPVIGFLDPRELGTMDDFLRAFRQGLKDTGYVEGDNVTIVYRFAENQFKRLPELATELVRRRVAVLCVRGACGQGQPARPVRCGTEAIDAIDGVGGRKQSPVTSGPRTASAPVRASGAYGCSKSASFRSRHFWSDNHL